MKTPALPWKNRQILPLIGALSLLALAPAARAYTYSTWSGASASDGNWSNTDNWIGGTVPNTTSLNALFNSDAASGWGSSAGNPVVIDTANLNLGGIYFDSTVGSYFIGQTNGNTIALANNGYIQLNTTVTSSGVTETINAPLSIQSAVFYNPNTNSANTIVINGNITDRSTSGTSILTLRGINSGANTINGIISNGSGGTVLAITKTDAGQWVLNGLNTFTGNVTVSSGTLAINSIANQGEASALGAGTTITLGQNQSSTTGRGSLLFTGTSGGSSNRNIVINNGANGGSAIITNAVAGQTLTLSGAITTATASSASSLTLNGAGNGVLSGNITGSPLLSLSKSGAGTWVISGSNTYTGTTTVSAGTLQFGQKSSLGSATWSAANIKVSSGATLALSVGGDSGFSASDVASILAIKGSSSTGFMSGSILGLDTTGATGGNFAYGSVIANAYTGSTLGLAKLGSGTLTLSAANTYSGVTSVNAGTLALDANGSIANTTAVNIAKGATFDVHAKTAAYAFGSTQTLTNNGTVYGTISVAGKLAGSGSYDGGLSLLGTSILEIQLNAGAADWVTVTDGDVAVNGIINLVLNGGSLEVGDGLVLIANTGSKSLTLAATDVEIDGVSVGTYSSGTFTYLDQQYALVATDADNDGNLNDLALQAVPEPATWAMLLGGLGLLAGGQKLRRRFQN